MPSSRNPEDRSAPDAPDQCPNCGRRGTFVEDEESGEMVCSNCGFVLREKEEDIGPEFSRSEAGVQQVGSGPPTSISQPDLGLETVIGRTGRDASGTALSPREKSTIARLRQWDSRAQTNRSEYRNLTKAFDEIKTIADRLSVGEEAVDRASYIYRKATQRQLAKGRSIVLLSAAALYAAFRELQIPRSLKDIAAAGIISKAQLSRSYLTLVRELDLRMPVEDPVRSVPKIGSLVGSSPKTMRRAQEILAKAESEGVSAGKEPMALAGAALYLASRLEGEGSSQKVVAKAAEVTEVTLRNRYKELKSSLNL